MIPIKYSTWKTIIDYYTGSYHYDDCNDAIKKIINIPNHYCINYISTHNLNNLNLEQKYINIVFNNNIFSKDIDFNKMDILIFDSVTVLGAEPGITIIICNNRTHIYKLGIDKLKNNGFSPLILDDFLCSLIWALGIPNMHLYINLNYDIIKYFVEHGKNCEFYGEHNEYKCTIKLFNISNSKIEKICKNLEEKHSIKYLKSDHDNCISLWYGPTLPTIDLNYILEDLSELANLSN